MNYRGILAVYLMLSFQSLSASDTADTVRNSGIRGGIVVHLGCGDGRQTASMLLNSSYLVHGLDTDADNVAKAKAYIGSQNLYGPVSVAKYDGKTLPYADNTVNLIVADTMGNVPVEEAMRVLTPLGAMIVGGKKTVKPWPKDIDDWPQYLNEADNNGVAQDSVAGPPRYLQWLDKPTWCRSHMGVPTVAGLVSGHGRLFSIEDTAPPDNPFLPAAFRMVARDAFNGKELWARKITRWESVTMYIKCQPVQQQRRMAVVGDTLYCTLELEGPVSALDAATGEVLKTYENTKPTQEVAYDQGILFLNCGDRFNTSAYNIVKLKGKPFVEGVAPSGPFYGAGFKDGYAPEIKDKANPVSAIVAVDPTTGNELWAIRNIVNYTAASLAIKGDYAVYQTANGLFCVDSKTGQKVWSQKKSIANAVGHDSRTPGTLPNTVVITDDKVFAVEGPATNRIVSNADNTVFAYSLRDGRFLWQAPAKGNYESSSDVFYVNGTLWVGGQNPTQLNADTGKVIKKIVQKMTGPMGHDRCYRNYITERYFINSKTGGADFLDLETSQEFPHHWTRGGCGSGVLPANGLVYTTPFSCQCSMGAMFQGMHAYASHQPRLQSSNQPIPVRRSVRLEKGPAFSESGSRRSTLDPRASSDWPAYRHDGFRSGITNTSVPASLSTRWKTKIQANPSAITAAAGKVFVCSVNTHTLYALNANTGETEWTCTADARIDSPPAYYKGRVLFGSRGGWVYCLRASDGELAWRFKDLPDKLIGAYGQLESAWPVSGSVLILNDTLYFAAGRCSYLDGGIFLYALNPRSGELLKSRSAYGPFDEDSGFPIGGDAGFKNDVLVTDGTKLYLRHKAFDLNLAHADGGKHIIPTSSFLDGQPQHRTSWTVGSTISKRSAGDILVSDGKTYYEVEGFPLYANHSYFDPRRSGYSLFARPVVSAPTTPIKPINPIKKRRAKSRGQGRGQGPRRELWHQNIPITGKAMAMAGNVLFVAGEPVKLDDYSYKTYVAAYNGELGGRLLALSATDGTQLAEYKLNAAPVWDSIAVADGRLYISLADGTVQCFGQ